MRKPILPAAAIVVALLVLSHPLWAATIIVDETTCTLVDAVTAANTDAAVGGCPAGSGADTIELTTDVTLTDPDNYFGGDNGLPVVESEITLEGNGFTIERDPAAPPFRFWSVDLLNPPTTWGDLTLNDVTLRNGSASMGGAIFSRGRLIMNGCSVEGNEATGTGSGGGGIGLDGDISLGEETRLTNTVLSGNSTSGSGGAILIWWYEAAWPHLENCVVSDNVADEKGGGISGEAVLVDSLVSGNVAGGFGGGLQGFHFRLANSTVSNNEAAHGGGGIQCYWLEAKDSTISNNSASGGGGIEQYWEWDYGYTSELTNVTISGNTAGYGGGGYATESSMLVTKFRNSTISGNTAPSGGGFYIDDFAGSSIEFRNTIVANSGSGGNCVGDSYKFIDLGSNFADDDTCGPNFGTITDLDPVLADNGGPTQTHALLPGSSAIDAAGDCGLGTDQRGEPRRLGECDSGSYEVQCSIAVTTDGVDTLIWFTPDSTEFTVVAGYLSDLLADGDFSRATCLGTYSANPAVDMLPEPPVGDGRYYLARGLTSCVGAHYGDSSLTPDPRDALAVGPCP